VASAAGRVFGLELEGLSGEDAEFEIARRFVNFAADAVKNIALAPPRMEPRSAALSAAAAAARAYARGLLPSAEGATGPQAQFRSSGGRSGRWSAAPTRSFFTGCERPCQRALTRIGCSTRGRARRWRGSLG
jgi:hypothetical protein